MEYGTDYSGFFPFGWLKNFRGDNWQIFWEKKSGDIFLKATAQSTLLKVTNAPDWVEAKKKADFLIENPDSVATGIKDC